ncbi:MAG: RNA pyrophosphohydrolase [Gammaproteobacteria bacterium]|nr:RNA pyrophosphohydrolase [Gammaproteobacteria bacterium]MBT6043843.1 RNA pyrophosphohydrolase [Gammaproteobacteria bacterium]
MIDSDGFRPNVGIIIFNGHGKLLWAKRLGQDAWQFPQGGVQRDESPEQAAFRELNEEVGLAPEDVEIIASTDKWLRYRLPSHLIRQNSHPVCIGQKQKWYLMRLLSDTQKIRFDLSEKPEFDHWRWVSYWYPVNQVVSFKRKVYRKALEELIRPFNDALQDLSDENNNQGKTAS